MRIASRARLGARFCIWRCKLHCKKLIHLALAQRIEGHKGRANIGSIAAPTLVIWGENDLALEKCTNNTLTRYAPNAEIVYLSKASHWVQMDEPATVNRLMLAFLGAAIASSTNPLADAGHPVQV